MQKTILPLGLLDFSLAHVQSVKWRCRSRNLHQAVALAPSPAPSFESAEGKNVFSRWVVVLYQLLKLMQPRRRGRRRTPGTLTIRNSGELDSSTALKLPKNSTSPMSELERRVLALQSTQVSLDVMHSQSVRLHFSNPSCVISDGDYFV
jgi:hypothetical protein